MSSIIHSLDLNVLDQKAVPGGDINEAHWLKTQDAEYFLKLNNAGRYTGMFEQEAKGLNTLRSASSLVVPIVIRHGQVEDEQYLLLEWLHKGSVEKNSMQNFGAALATQHQQAQSFFGWHENNFIGSLVQLNNQHPSWHSFYAACRILPLVKHLVEAGNFSRSDSAATSLLCTKLKDMFPEEPPALLHGDLWGGNYLVTKNGKVAVFDPAVYYGHREMDLGMTRLFGGFDDSFYDGYQLTYPLEKGWQQRLPLTQLYPILVHAVLFGGHYIASARQIIQQFA
ncbi:MAG: fructosamine kinase family protein [Ferruginibacter sp.]